jgi:general secretion pathway protein D
LAVIFVTVAVWAISVYGPTFDLGKLSSGITSSAEQKETQDKQVPDDQQGKSVKTEDKSASDKPDDKAAGEETKKTDEKTDPGKITDPNEKTEPDKKTDPDKKDDGKEAAGDDEKDKEGKDKSKDKDKEEEAEKVDDPNELVAINLNDVDMKYVIQTLGEWTQMPIIPTDPKLMGIKVMIHSPIKVPRHEALSLLQDALRTKGCLVEYAHNKIYLKPLATAKLGSVPTIGADEPLARIQDKSQIVEKFFKVKNYNPSKLALVITPLIAEYGHVTAVEDADMISVIDTVENLIRIKRIIDQFDVPESEQTVKKVFEIENADVLEIVQILQMILEKGKVGKGSRPPANAAKGDAKTATSIVIEPGRIPLKLVPIPRQKWIIATGSADDIERVTEWIEKLDASGTAEQERTIVQLEFVEVREVINIIESMIEDMPGSELRTNLIVEPLETSRQIVIIGSKENRKMIEDMIFDIDMPFEDIFEEETFVLKHADPDQVKENIEGLYSDDSSSSYNPYSYYSYRSRSRTDPKDKVKIISYPTMSRVTVNASKKNMEKIRAQIAEWDIPLDIGSDQYRIYTLKNSDPVELTELLATLFSENEEKTPSRYTFIFGDGAANDKKKIVGNLYGMFTFEPVPDTKKIIVISKVPEAYDFIEKLIIDLDSQEMAEVPVPIVLKYADAEELCDQLNAILNEPGTTATIRRRAKGLSEYQSPTSNNSSNNSNSNNQQSSSSNEIRPPWNQQRGRDDEMPTSNLIGKIRFIPVHRSKAILVLAPPEYLPSIRDMIDQLDQPGKQVMIKAVIVEVDHTKMTSLGVELLNNSTKFADLGTNTLSALAELAGSTSLGSAAVAYAFNVNAVLDVLIKNVDAKILNQPTLWTKDNEEAIFFKGQYIAFLEGNQSDTTGQSIKNSYNYDNVGVTLRVRPNITPEKAVDVTINLEISQVEPDDVNGQVAINKLDTTTSLIVNDGETIMLGGILFQTETDIRTKVPLLGDIPILGGFFRHKDTVQSNNELLVFITPYVIDGPGTKAETTRQIETPKLKMKAVADHLDELFNNSDDDNK